MVVLQLMLMLVGLLLVVRISIGWGVRILCFDIWTTEIIARIRIENTRAYMPPYLLGWYWGDNIQVSEI